jgi:ribosomal protein L9
MKVKLLRDSKIMHKAGEIVEVSPVEANFLLSVCSAIEVRTENVIEQPEKTTRKRGAKKE